MAELYYQITQPERLQLLSQDGFDRSADRIWRHADGRAIGESTVAAITDESFLRFLGAEDQSEGTETARAGNE